MLDLSPKTIHPNLPSININQLVVGKTTKILGIHPFFGELNVPH